MQYKLYKPKSIRNDEADEKRVELHVHTKMTALEGVSELKMLVARAAKFGHRAIAVTDTGVVQAFHEAEWAVKRVDTPIKLLYGMEAIIRDAETGVRSRAVLLAKTQKGLKNLYKLVSWSHLENLHGNTPCVTKEKLTEWRDGLLIGCCTAGDLFRAVLDGQPREALCGIAEFYDYLEIQPADTYRSVFDGAVTQEQLLAYNQTVIDLGEALNIPVCATGNVYFCDPEDEIYRRILMHRRLFEGENEHVLFFDAYPRREKQKRDAKRIDEPAPLYLRTTEEMLDAFSYLGAEKAHEVVVSNPCRIADSIDAVQLLPKGIHYPQLEGVQEELVACVRSRAKQIYGDPLPELVSERLERELKTIVENGFSVFYVIAKRLVEDSEAHGYPVGSRGAVGSSLVAFLAGITAVNPLPPHYVCPSCGHSEFFPVGTVGSGFDLPDKVCPVCSAKMKGDGHDIPFETFAGLHGDKEPDIDLHFAEEYQPCAQDCLRSMFGNDRVIIAGVISALTFKTAYPYVRQYASDRNVTIGEEEAELLAEGLCGIKRTTGSHPGGLFVFPENFDVEDFTPLQHPANDPEAGISTHFCFCDLDTCLKMDLLCFRHLDILRQLEKDTGVKAGDIPMNDPAVYSLLSSPAALGVTPEQIGRLDGTLSLPELDTPFVRKILPICRPDSFSDLIKISGLSHGTNVWTDNAEVLIGDGVCSLTDFPAARDDIMNDLMAKGVDKETAFNIMEATRKRKANRVLTKEMTNDLLERGVPEWYIGSLRRILYMFPKAYAVTYMINAVRLGWYKLYYPKEYYRTYLAVRGDDESAAETIQALRQEARCRGVEI